MLRNHFLVWCLNIFVVCHYYALWTQEGAINHEQPSRDYIVCFVASSLVDMFLSASMQVSCFLQIQNTSLIFHLNSCISVTSFCGTPCIYSAHSVSSGMAIVLPAAVISDTGCRAVFSDTFIYLFSKRKVLIWTYYWQELSQARPLAVTP